MLSEGGSRMLSPHSSVLEGGVHNVLLEAMDESD